MTEPTLAQASPEITAAQEAIVGAFALFDDWTDRYQYIIDLGKKLPDLRPEQTTEEHRLKGCQSQVWMVAEARDGRLYYEAISDSSIASARTTCSGASASAGWWARCRWPACR